MSPSPLARALRLVDAFRIQRELRTRDVVRLLGVGRATALRTLRALEQAGVPIAPVGEGRERRWVVTDERWRKLGLRATVGDTFALHFGRQLLGFVDGTALTSWHDELQEKLRVGADGRSAELEERLAKRFVFLSEPYREYRDVDEVLEEVVTALVHNVELTLAYADKEPWDGVRPLALVVYRRALYLLVRFGEAAQVFRLAVERLRSARRSSVTFDYPRDFDAQQELSRTFGIFDDRRPVELVRLRFSPEVADLVARRVWHPTARVVSEPDGHALLTLRATGRELSRLALEFGPTVEVLGPAWLREDVRRQLALALAQYD